jgi:nicotinamidase/pyrazinamidase
MQLPEFYSPDRVGEVFAPRAGEASASAYDVRSNANPRPGQASSVLLLVDIQVDFVHTNGSLSIPGAVDDTRRTIEWLYRNTDGLNAIIASLDSHVPMQIFSPMWWVDEAGNPPAPYTPISHADVRQRRWRPVRDHAWSEAYVAQLEQLARKTLMIWPYHTLIGTPGHAIEPSLAEAILFHSAFHQTNPTWLVKGRVPDTEHYSIFEPEVKVPDNAEAQLNTALLEQIATYDRIIVAGQAKSHCVLETVVSMASYFAARQDVLDRITVLMDTMSSVAHPEIDFEALAMEQWSALASQGIRLSTTNDTSV